MKAFLIFVLAIILSGCSLKNSEETVIPALETVSEEDTEVVEEEVPEISVNVKEPYSGDLLYFTRLSVTESEEISVSGDELVTIEETYRQCDRAYAALCFDFSLCPEWHIYSYRFRAVSYTDSIPNVNSVVYLRMEGDGVLYPLNSEKLSEPTGYTADGKAYVIEEAEYVHPEVGESGVEYQVTIAVDDKHEGRISFYSYLYDEDFREKMLLPLLKYSRIWTSEMPMRLLFTGETLEAEMTLPDTWLWNNSSVADDVERVFLEAPVGVKRMEFYPEIHDEVWLGYERLVNQGIPEPITGMTNERLAYEVYAYDSFSEMNGEGVVWYFVSVGLPGDQYAWVSFLSFAGDSIGYFDSVIVPVVESSAFRVADTIK